MSTYCYSKKHAEAGQPIDAMFLVVLRSERVRDLLLCRATVYLKTAPGQFEAYLGSFTAANVETGAGPDALQRLSRTAYACVKERALGGWFKVSVLVIDPISPSRLIHQNGIEEEV